MLSTWCGLNRGSDKRENGVGGNLLRDVGCIIEPISMRSQKGSNCFSFDNRLNLKKVEKSLVSGWSNSFEGSSLLLILTPHSDFQWQTVPLERGYLRHRCCISQCNCGKYDNLILDAWHGHATSNVDLNHDLCVTWYPLACLLYNELIGSQMLGWLII